ncbi:MAG: exosortase/archaeosortase family protein [Acidobacteriota bacterium]
MKIRLFLTFAALLVACFSQPFVHLVRFAFAKDLFSYVLLIPFISVYLAWIRRKDLPHTSGGAPWPAAIPAAAGLGLLVTTHFAHGRMTASESLLPLQMLSFCLLLWSGGFVLLGSRTMRALAFPFLFLVFMAPIPPSIVGTIETGLQHASADLSYRFIQLAGIPVYRSGLDFYMPRIALSVAQECSGIRSTLVLFMSALVAGHLFLRTAWTRWILVLIVIPLGIARNAFRILVLAWLCVRVDVAYIHSPIHRSGGPLFFVLSLIPFGAVLFWLRRTERRGRHYTERHK